MLQCVQDRVVLELLVATHAMAVANMDLTWQPVVPGIHALGISRSHLVSSAQHPVLVRSLAMARVGTNQSAIAVAHLVQAHVAGCVQTATMLNVVVVRDEQVRQDRVQVPLERLAMQSRSQALALGGISRINVLA